MDPRLTKAQRDLDALLPEFLTIADPDKLKGTCWITVTDLALSRPASACPPGVGSNLQSSPSGKSARLPIP